MAFKFVSEGVYVNVSHEKPVRFLRSCKSEFIEVYFITKIAGRERLFPLEIVL